jgi:radical SAM superfamily enzyme YgiQ (UPF0313 family)
VYKGSKFELRPVREIINDIETIRRIADSIKQAAWKSGYGNNVRDVALGLYDQPQHGPCVRHVALWLATGSSSVFLQDSNTLVMRTSELIEVIISLRRTFSRINRITTYARSHTAAKKSAGELKELKDAGLSRIHIGLETGHDPLLAYMEKGCTSKHHIEGGRKVKEAGISLCEYIMPGLGGKRMFREHVRDTARVLNEIDPDYIRLRSLHVSPAMPLWRKVQEGDFQLRTEDEVVEEIGLLIQDLQVHSYLKSDHMLNLLMEVEGKMPEDKERCLAIINKYLSLADEEKLNFKLGRRLGYYTKLADLDDSYKHEIVERWIKRLEVENSNLDQVLWKLKNNLI